MGYRARCCPQSSRAILFALATSCARQQGGVVSDHQGEAPPAGAGFEFPEYEHPLTVLVPTAVAPYCYLYEALLWVAVQRGVGHGFLRQRTALPIVKTEVEHGRK